ncbi:cyclic nucleotide-gated cation channel beta-1 [Drosophila sulfurigaster albostrigata]|uniref:cyclic nucleotide-gated cation channel beta-1 n=1 Tax=Drosophila sulfurigaster albostrigata TaxID=89887 RepID=UPI002D21EBD4|nr:cyclic nucleotide-gated cation channel beta-1 [Drosophila sulfurigaster albostrigata]
MASMRRFRKLNQRSDDTDYDDDAEATATLLRSSPNILENYAYDQTTRIQAAHAQLKRMATTPRQVQVAKRPPSPRFCETLERHAFMRNVINTRPEPQRRYSTPGEKEAHVRRSLEEISKDIKEIEQFVSATEQLLQREKEQERQADNQQRKQQRDKENKTPSPAKHKITYKINAYKAPAHRRQRPNSPRFYHSRLYFRNGRIGCLDAERSGQGSNIESTHALVKHILKHEKPLVSPDSVRRVLQPQHYIEMTPLPGAVPEPEDPIAAQRAAELRSATGQVILEPTQPDQCDEHSQAMLEDEDEQDVQICYNESPELQNNDRNMRSTRSSSLNDSEIVAVVEADAVVSSAEQQRPSSAGSLDSQGQQFLRDQVRHLVRRFTARANKVKSRIELPPTPSSSNASSPTPPTGNQATLHASTKSLHPSPGHKVRLVPAGQSPHRGRLFEADTPRSNVWLCSSLCGANNDERTLDPQGKIYISWLCVVSLSFLYNAWVIPLRASFPFQTKENTNIWLACDFCADIIYLLDVVFFKHRIMYLFEGFWVKNKNLTRKNYMRKLQFKLDILALLPLELFYLKYGTGAVWLRFPRFFKIQSFWEVFRLLDRVISSPHFVRVAKTLTYMLYMIHITAALYYAYSDYQGLGQNRWVFSGRGHPYVRCFAFATKTATSIGKNPKPERQGEYVFMTVAWLMGVFVFALLIGQIRDIISTATRNRHEYRQLEDETLEYMRRLNLSQEVQSRVKMWFQFTWEQQRTLDESNILDALPINLKTDIAISVHIQTLSKVQLFADCEEALLRDLVLKLRAVTFLPGDFVCRKGEVGREMYIVKLGQVQVMGGPGSDVVLATLTEGSVFGEISLLGINGADRRTADVRSKGYSNLFVLSKSDLNEVIAYYPNAQAILKKRARQLMRKNAAREREEERERARSALQADVVIGNPKTPETPPKLLQTVIQALPYESPAVVLITRGSKRVRRKRQSVQMETIVEPTLDVAGCAEATQQSGHRDRDSLIMKPGRGSPDLLSSIQQELKTKHKFINLTDSEKALIITQSANNSMECVQEDVL